MAKSQQSNEKMRKKSLISATHSGKKPHCVPTNAYMYEISNYQIEPFANTNTIDETHKVAHNNIYKWHIMTHNGR